MALLRKNCQKRGWLSSKMVGRAANNSHARVAGIVINRQHPNAGGTIFITLEDEYGHINIVIWERVVQQHMKAVIHGRLLLVEGKLERDGRLVHLIAEHIDDYSHWLGQLETKSRDFC
jgi:error-prone DNA polymerase